MRTTLTGLTSRRPFTLLGILLALLVIGAFVLVALNSNSGSGVAQQSVVVATKDLQPRIPIDAGSLEIKSVPIIGSATNFYTKLSDVAGMVPLVTIPTGQAITTNVVAQPNAVGGQQSAYLPIPSGYVALTIPTSEQQGVADYIQQNDYISVIATVVNGTKVSTQTIFTNLHVIRVGTFTNSATSSTSVSSLTVVVTQCQAEYITWFLTYASLKYSLESYLDYLKSGGQAADPKCPTVDAAKGVTLQTVQAAYPTLF